MVTFLVSTAPGAAGVWFVEGRGAANQPAQNCLPSRAYAALQVNSAKTEKRASQAESSRFPESEPPKGP